MKFDLSEDQALLRSSTRDFLTSELPLDKSRHVMEHNPDGYEAAQWRSFAEMGYIGLALPAGAGGQGLGTIELAIVLEELGRVCAPGPFLDAVLAASLLAAAGGQDALLADIVSGKSLVAIARQDSAFSGNHVTATKFESGRVLGTKYFVPFAARTDALLITTRQGVVLVRAPYDIVPLQTIDLGQRFGEVKLDHQGTLVGGPELLERVDRVGAVGAGAMMLGIMRRAREVTLDYVQTRQAFKRPIGGFQALQHRLADMLLKTESTRSAVYRAAWCLDTDDRDTALACATAKAYAGDASRYVCGEAVQMHGGIGFTWELDLHFYFKRAKTLEQFYGSTEVQLEKALAAAGY